MSPKNCLTVIFLLTITTNIFAQSDMKITKRTQMKMPGMPAISDQDLSKMPAAAQERMKNRLKHESVVYIKGSRMRTDTDFEVPSGFKIEKRRQTIIQQCDKQRMIEFNDKKKKYYVKNFDGTDPPRATTESGRTPIKSSANRGVITVSVNVADTGERTKLFGYNTRHIKQTMSIAPSGASSCLKSKMQIDIDGWYADLSGFSCSLKPDIKSLPAGGGCGDEVRYEIKGTPLTGIPLKEIKTMVMDGTTMTIEEEVVELVNTTLDAAFFEPPAGYTPADGEAEISDQNGQRNDILNPSLSSPAPVNSALGITLPPATPAAGITEQKSLVPKKAGTIRIGVLLPKAEIMQTQKQAQTGETTNNSALIQAAFVKTLTGVNVEAVPLAAETFAESSSEAKQIDCDYILASSLAKRKGGSLLSTIIPMVVSSIVPGGGLLTYLIKAKDKMTLEYQLVRVEQAAPTLNGKFEAKAAKDGEDIISPLIAQSVTAILAQVKKP